ncbi:MAG: methylmalonyl Co-A mutase-associated GTPase MeaB [Euryarchaeota archaeon]|jgi:LAO/AO transport system kinase|nr:methylmalonyl Co-A mutase-associated GTPase MeaB [Euryarchaeota archaeon]
MALGVTPLGEQIEAALSGDRRSLARLLSRIEEGELLGLPEVMPWTLGVTGPPGVGKSTLIGKLVEYWADNGEKVAVLAVDPSSPRSGGALLADRMRMDSADSGDAVFFRSLATRGHPGGVSHLLSPMADLLCYCGWSRIIIETVGSGQAETRIVAFADRVLMVDGPDRGDIIQAEKAGIIELADIIAVNKSDKPGARRAADSIRSSLELGNDKNRPEVHLVSAHNSSGVEELVVAIEKCSSPDWRNRLRITERLLSIWDSRLIMSDGLDDVLDDLETGSITLDEALDRLLS